MADDDILFDLEEAVRSMKVTSLKGTNWTISIGLKGSKSSNLYPDLYLLQRNNQKEYDSVLRIDSIWKHSTDGPRAWYIRVFGEAHGPRAAVIELNYGEFLAGDMFKCSKDPEGLLSRVKSFNLETDWSEKVFSALSDYVQKHCQMSLKDSMKLAEKYVLKARKKSNPERALSVRRDADNTAEKETNNRSRKSPCSGNSSGKRVRAMEDDPPSANNARPSPYVRSLDATDVLPIAEEQSGADGTLAGGKRMRGTKHGKKAPTKRGRPSTTDPEPKTFSSAMDRLAEEGEKNVMRRILKNNAPRGADSMSIHIDRIHPPIRDRSSVLPPHQIRHISPSFLSDLKKRMIRDFNAFAGRSMLLLDPDTCAPEDWRYKRRNRYMYYAVGGNHTICAQADLVYEKPDFDCFLWINANVVVGLTEDEQRYLAWTDNVDAEYRSKLSTLNRIVYIHERWLELGQPEKDYNFKYMMAEEIHFDGWGARDAKIILNTYDNHFQLAFRTGRIWIAIQNVFHRYERGQIKGQKLEGPKSRSRSKKAKGVVEDETSQRVLDMKLTDWVSMQGVYNETAILAILSKVAAGELSFPEMAVQFKSYKMGIKVEKSFAKELGCKDWEECKLLYPEVRTIDRWAYTEAFEHQASLAGERKKKSKGVQPAAEDDGPLKDSLYPQIFKSFVRHAEALRTMREKNPEDVVDASQYKFDHKDYGSIYYDILQGDARDISKIPAAQRRPYTLMIADIPYGLQLPQAGHNDGYAWQKEDVVDMIKSFKVMTTAKLWRVIIIHSLEQAPAVIAALKEECTCGKYESGYWYKPNAMNDGGPRLINTVELFTIGYGCMGDQPRGRDVNQYSFRRSEVRSNHVEANTVTKYRCFSNKEVINGYQKPRKLYNWFLCHFSQPRDWVMDLCSGSGTGILSAIGCGRHCVAVEVDKRQFSMISGRVNMVEDDLHGRFEDDSAEEVAEELTNAYCLLPDKVVSLSTGTSGGGVAPAGTIAPGASVAVGAAAVATPNSLPSDPIVVGASFGPEQPFRSIPSRVLGRALNGQFDAIDLSTVHHDDLAPLSFTTASATGVTSFDPSGIQLGGHNGCEENNSRGNDRHADENSDEERVGEDEYDEDEVDVNDNS